MKKVLITGENSYIGESFKKLISDIFYIKEIDVRGGHWRKADFSEYDVVFNVAGIAHIKPRADREKLFFEVNRDLAIELAKKAKSEGVKQFIHMSSMNVFGDIAGRVTKRTVPEPISFYGQSKLDADNAIQKLNSESFKVVSLRPPMVYGKDCKGNYPRLSKLACNTFVFPMMRNERSMIHIENLCEFIKLIIVNNCSGIYYPQNREYVCTTDMVRRIAEAKGHKIVLVKGFAWLIRILVRKINFFNKVFGTETYSMDMSNTFDFKYCVNNFNDSIIKTET